MEYILPSVAGSTIVLSSVGDIFKYNKNSILGIKTLFIVLAITSGVLIAVGIYGTVTEDTKSDFNGFIASFLIFMIFSLMMGARNVIYDTYKYNYVSQMFAGVDIVDNITYYLQLLLDYAPLMHLDTETTAMINDILEIYRNTSVLDSQIIQVYIINIWFYLKHIGLKVLDSKGKNEDLMDVGTKLYNILDNPRKEILIYQLNIH